MRRAIACASGRLELPAISFGLNWGFIAAPFPGSSQAPARALASPPGLAKPRVLAMLGRRRRGTRHGRDRLLPLSALALLLPRRAPARGDRRPPRRHHRLQARGALPHLRRG